MSFTFEFNNIKDHLRCGNMVAAYEAVVELEKHIEHLISQADTLKKKGKKKK